MVERPLIPLEERPLPLGNLMTAASRRLAAELDAGLVAAGFPELRAAHSPVFQVIDPDGNRLTELADRAGMTKQAMGELVRYLVKHGFMKVSPDPADARARIVALTVKGWEVVDAGSAVVERFDALLNETIGADEVVRLRSTLMQIVGGAGATFSRGKAEAVTVWRT